MEDFKEIQGKVQGFSGRLQRVYNSGKEQGAKEERRRIVRALEGSQELSVAEFLSEAYRLEEL